jgi:hypothetical protein
MPTLESERRAVFEDVPFVRSRVAGCGGRVPLNKATNKAKLLGASHTAESLSRLEVLKSKPSGSGREKPNYQREKYSESASTAIQEIP